MPARSPVVLLAVLACAACTFDPALPQAAVVRCTDGACPVGFVCRARVGLCVPADRADSDAPSLRSASLTPTYAKLGATIRLELTVDEPLGAPPVASLAQAGRSVAMTLEGTPPADAASFVFTYRPTEQDLEGPAAALVDLVDVSGNAASGLRAGAVTLDFTPPSVLQVTYVAPRSAEGVALDVREDEAVEIRVVASEPVQPTAQLSAAPVACPGGAPTFRRSSTVGSLLDYFAPPPAGTPGCEYVLRLSELVDLAGNAASTATLDTAVGYRVLTQAPAIDGFEALRAVDGGWLPAAAFSHASGFDRLGVRFRLGPTATGFELRLDDAPFAACTLSGCARLAQDGGFGCFCERALISQDREGLHALQVSVRDGPGQTRGASLPLRFDFTPPGLAPGSVQLLLTPGADSPIPVVGALGPGGTARLFFSVDEPISSRPTLSVAPGPLDVAFAAGTATSFSYTLALPADAGTAGLQRLAARVEDDVANVAQLELFAADAGLLVDSAAPTPPATTAPGRVVYERAPWGDAQGVVRFAVVGQGGAAEPGALLRVLDGPDSRASLEVGRGWADDAGAFSVALTNADRRAVWVTAVDLAGSQSAPVDVKDVAWVATLGGKQLGSTIENPHALFGRPAFRRSWVQTDDTELAFPERAAFVDGARTRSAGALAWTPRGADAGTRASSGSLAYDSERGVLVWFDAINARVFEYAPALGWVSIAPTDPEGDGSPAAILSGSVFPMVFDTRRAKTVLVYDSPQIGAPPDTWEWDGASWAYRGSAPRLTERALAYDEDRGVSVGYARAGLPSAQTWEWDGARWAQITPTTPARPTAQQGFALAWDPTSRAVLLFGGSQPGPPFSIINELWAWNGQQWTNLGPSSGPRPTGRQTPGFVGDGARGRMLLFGGRASTGWQNDTWEWNGTAWSARDAGPAPMAQPSPALAWDSQRQVVSMSGALNLPAETWDWDGGGWTQAPSPPSGGPGLRTDHALTYDSVRHVAVLFGGNVPVRGDTWEWDGTAWALRASTGPLPRRGHALAFDRARGRTVLFGGTNQGDGTSGATQYADTWEWDGTSWALRADAGPPERWGHGLAFDEARGRTVLFGGYQRWGTLAVADTWAWDGTSWAKVADAGTGPSARFGTRLAYDARRGAVILSGGATPSVPTAETWEWNGAAWRDATDAGGPSARGQATFTFDESLGQALLIGGAPSAYTNEVWGWSGLAWTNLAPGGAVAMAPRIAHAAAYDAARRVTVVYGGQIRTSLTTGQTVGDTWELGLPQAARPGQVVHFAFAAARPELGSSVQDLRVRAWVGGHGTAGGQPVDGARLWLFDQGTYVAAAEHDAGVAAPAPLELSRTSAAVLQRVLLDGAQQVGVAVTPVGTNGAEPAEVVLDAVELTVHYRRP